MFVKINFTNYQDHFEEGTLSVEPTIWRELQFFSNKKCFHRGKTGERNGVFPIENSFHEKQCCVLSFKGGQEFHVLHWIASTDWDPDEKESTLNVRFSGLGPPLELFSLTFSVDFFSKTNSFLIIRCRLSATQDHELKDKTRKKNFCVVFSMQKVVMFLPKNNVSPVFCGQKETVLQRNCWCSAKL